MTSTLRKDVIIVGGGIAGLWLLQRLRGAGYDAALLERDRLGGGQTIASQGMIHGGIKYALGGRLTGASNAIADMPALWGACLDGRGEVDLRHTRILSRHYYMWPRQSVRSRLNAFLGSKALRGRIEALAQDDFPAFFQGRIPGPLYRLTDLVLDVPSLLATLSEAGRGAIHRIDWGSARLLSAAGGGIEALHLDTGAGPCRIEASRYVFTAGAGTQSLLRDAGLEGSPMQRRPLHMVMVRHRIPHPLYVHCVTDQLSGTPEVTITTHPCGGGEQAWYLGGELAESGVGLSGEEQIGRARRKLDELFPWIDLDQARWAGFPIDRAEPRQPLGGRPDRAFVEPRHNFLVCWPTKLALAPSLANDVLRSLRDQGIMPGARGPAFPLPLPAPDLAAPPWESAFS